MRVTPNMLKATNLTAEEILGSLNELHCKFWVLEKNECPDWVKPELEKLVNDPEIGEYASVILKCLPFVGERVEYKFDLTVNAPADLDVTKVQKLINTLIETGMFDANETLHDDYGEEAYKEAEDALSLQVTVTKPGEV